MKPLRFELVVDRPVDQVFAYVTDSRNNVEWFRGVRAVRVLSLVDHGVGAEYEQDNLLFGWRFTARMRVTEYVPPARLSLLSTVSATPYTATFTFQSIDAGQSTRMVLDTKVVGASVYRYMGRWFFPLLHRAVTKRLHLLRDILEGQRTPIRHASTGSRSPSRRRLVEPGAVRSGPAAGWLGRPGEQWPAPDQRLDGGLGGADRDGPSVVA